MQLGEKCNVYIRPLPWTHQSLFLRPLSIYLGEMD